MFPGLAPRVKTTLPTPLADPGNVETQPHHPIAPPVRLVAQVRLIPRCDSAPAGRLIPLEPEKQLEAF